MAVLTLGESRGNSNQLPATPEQPETDVSTLIEDAPRSEPTQEMLVVAALRNEIDSYLCRLKQFGRLGPDEVMLQLSAITARLTEMRVQVIRTTSHRFTALRTKEIDPLLVECERQFRLHSRVQAIRAFDWEVSGRGQV